MRSGKSCTAATCKGVCLRRLAAPVDSRDGNTGEGGEGRREASQRERERMCACVGVGEESGKGGRRFATHTSNEPRMLRNCAMMGENEGTGPVHCASHARTHTRARMRAHTITCAHTLTLTPPIREGGGLTDVDGSTGDQERLGNFPEPVLDSCLRVVGGRVQAEWGARGW